MQMEASNMSEKYSKIKAIVNSYEGLNLRDNKNGQGFKFPVYLMDSYKELDIEVLDLSMRSYHCLKRAGYDTIYDLMSGITGRLDLKKIRNCGDNSSLEIMEKLFLFQYMNLKPEQRDWYIKKIAEINT